MSQEFQTVHFWNLQIRHDQVWRALLQVSKGFLAISRAQYRQACGFQIGGQGAVSTRVITNDQHGFLNDREGYAAGQGAHWIF